MFWLVGNGSGLIFCVDQFRAMRRPTGQGSRADRGMRMFNIDHLNPLHFLLQTLFFMIFLTSAVDHSFFRIACNCMEMIRFDWFVVNSWRLAGNLNCMCRNSNILKSPVQILTTPLNSSAFNVINFLQHVFKVVFSNNLL